MIRAGLSREGSPRAAGRLGRAVAMLLTALAGLAVRSASGADPASAPESPTAMAGQAAVPTTHSVDGLIEKLVPPRSDSPADWWAPPLCLYAPGEPRLLPPCVPPAPCHPGQPPRPLDLVGVVGAATCGPRYRGPCEPRLGTHDHGRLPRLHGLCDRAFDAFYR